MSQRQVELANHARVARDAGQEEGHRLTLRAGGQEMQVIFFPDESGGANPFGPLAQQPPPGAPRDQAANDLLLAQAIEAARQRYAHLTPRTGARAATGSFSSSGSKGNLLERMSSKGDAQIQRDQGKSY